MQTDSIGIAAVSGTLHARPRRRSPYPLGYSRGQRLGGSYRLLGLLTGADPCVDRSFHGYDDVLLHSGAMYLVKYWARDYTKT